MMTPTRIDRAEFLQTLESVRPALTPRITITQSNCFCFKKSWVITFDGYFSIRAKTPFSDDLTVAVVGPRLVEAVSKMTSKELTVSFDGSVLKIAGPGEYVKPVVEASVDSPLDKIAPPGKWFDLDPDFGEAVQLAVACTLPANPDKAPCVQAVHVTPTIVEGSDNYQAVRFRLDTRFPKGVLVNRDHLKHVPVLGMTQASVGDGWLHFRNPAGLTLSCQLYEEDYPESEGYFDFKGSHTSLPKGLVEDSKFAQTYSQEIKDSDVVTIDLKPGYLRVRGEGVTGEAGRERKVRYDGPKMSFTIPPTLLAEIATKHTEVEVTNTRLKVDGGRWQYMTVLGTPQNRNGKP